MPSFDKRTNFYDKKLLDRQDYYNYFFLFLNNKLDEVVSSTFLNNAGVLSAELIELIGGSTNNTFTADISSASKGTDANGNIMDLSLVTSSWYEDYPIENANGSTYYIGFKYASIVDSVENNTGTGESEYSYYKEAIGELGYPDSVSIESGPVLRLVIDGILENGVDHSDRPVAVWLVNPISNVAATAIYEGVITYDSGTGENRIEIAYSSSAGPLGQTDPPYPISTTATDYQVHIQGLSWFKNTDISTDSDYVFLGTMTGNDTGGGAIPATFDMSNQVSALYMSLQNAYYAGTSTDPAPGRKIVANRGAVEISQSNTSARDEDIRNATLVLDQSASTASSINLLMLEGTNMSTGAMDLSYGNLHLKQFADGTNIQDEEVGTTTSGANTVTLTRGAVDAQEVEDYTYQIIFGQIKGTPSGIDDGIYIVNISSATSLTMINLDGSSPSFAGNNACTVNFFIPITANISSDWTTATASSAVSTHQFGFNRVSNGVEITHHGSTGGASADESYWLRADIAEPSGMSSFYTLFGARHYLTGGGAATFNTYAGVDVVGWANHTIDKRTIEQLQTDWQPTEATNEMGYDYRGTSFGRGIGSGNDQPGYQFGQTIRMPFWYDEGSDLVQVEEPFTQISADTIRCTRTGFANTNIPDLDGCLLVELQYNTANNDDGIYLLKSVVSSPTTDLTLMNFDGSAPTLQSGTGNIRLYGGVFTGALYGSAWGGAGVDSWLQQITLPTTQTCGTRYSSIATSNVAQSGTWAAHIATYNSDELVFSTDVSGLTYSKAITTKNTSGDWGDSPTAWDSLTTGNVYADDVYPTELHLTEGTYDGVLPTTITDCDVLKRDGGSTWSVTKQLNIYNGLPGSGRGTPGEPDWDSPDVASDGSTPDATAGIHCIAGDGEYRLPIEVPQGATITSISVYVDPTTDDNSGGAFSIKAWRQATTGTMANLNNIGTDARADDGTGNPQYVTLTCDNTPETTVNNAAYQYFLRMEGSATGGDIVYSARVTYTMSNIGECWFYAG